ncbi:MAG: BtrH N-terminal domain-containing protein [Planctomycetota bacterium]
MTDQKAFKRRVRERMTKTGESYTTARRQLLPAGSNEIASMDARRARAFPGLLPGCSHFGGIHSDTAILCNAFNQAGIVSPHDGKPFSEAMLFGLCGGIGFMYFVFEYKGHHPILSFVARNWSLPDEFADGALDRTGVKSTRKTSGTAAPAKKALDQVLANGRTAICTVDPVRLPYLGLPQAYAGNAAELIGVVGVDGDSAWIDDRCFEPSELSLAELAAARASYKKAKHRLVAIDGQDRSYDLAVGITEALDATVRSFHEARFKGYASNFGFAGLEKWRTMLVDTKDPKSWRKVFATREHAFIALQRTYECIHYQVTPPAGGRPLYADFLEEAAEVTGKSALAEAADALRKSAVLWDEIGALALPDDDPTRARAREIMDCIDDTLREQGSRAGNTVATLRAELEELPKSSRIEPADAFAVFDAMAERVAAIIEIERRALELLA